MFSDILLSFLRKLQIPEDDIIKSEAIDTFVLDVTIEAKSFHAISTQEIQMLLASFSPSITIIVGEEICPLMEITEQKSPDDISLDLEKIKRLPDSSTIRISVKINKKLMLDLLTLNKEINYYFFFFYENFIMYTSNSLHIIDRNFFSSDKATCFIIANKNFKVSGELLHIYSESEFFKNTNIETNVDYKKIGKTREIISNEIIWGNFSLKNITPHHFICTNINDMYDEILPIISRLLLHSIVLHSANRIEFLTQGDEKVYQAFYSNSERKFSISLCNNRCKYNYEVLSSLASWLFSGNIYDKLVIFQNSVALCPGINEQDQNLSTFLNNLNSLLTNSQWHYRLFIKGEINEHFEVVESLIDYVAKTSTSYSEKLNSLTNGITETFLTTIGLIFFSILTEIINPDANLSLIYYALVIYAIYIIVFQIIYRLGGILWSFIILNNETKIVISNFNFTLGKDKVNDLIRPYINRKVQFITILIISCICYATLSYLMLRFGQEFLILLNQSGIFIDSPQVMTFPTETITPIL
ncbi:MAG: hypothetical protein H0S79_09755 [Anaerolineaceae bacterium]|nr:hypothetical protein [Anaerolineaceae bacterium]